VTLTTTVRKAEFDRQVQTLVDLGYPPLADLSETAFRALLEPLRERVTAYGQLEEPTAEMVPFVLVIGRRLVRPDAALVTVTDAGRSPLTTDEGVALITHYPHALEKNHCFQLLGSRCGDRRVPGLWISDRRPKLGFCWAGNLHTWLGAACCAQRA